MPHRDHPDRPDRRPDDPGRPDPAEDAGDAGGAALSPADRLRARAAATDRAARFASRLDEVRVHRARRRRLRWVVRLAWVALLAGLGALVPLLVAAVVVAPDPGGGQVLLGAAVGAAVGWLAPPLRDALARRRGSRAWDAYHERYVLLGDPSAEVRDADRPRPGRR